MCTAAATLLQIDGTLITIALPSVAAGLGVGANVTAWVLTSYFAAYALCLWPGGRLVDARGPRVVAIVGLCLFGLGAMVGAMAGSFGLLVASRIVQGAGAGLVSPAALAGAVSGFPPERRGTALGIWGAGAGMANLVGPLLGGVLTVWLGWRADWWALVPATGACFLAIGRVIPSGEGSAVVASGEAPRLKRDVIAAAILLATLTFAVMIGSFYLAEQYLQDVAGFSALGASSALLFVALLVGAAAPVAGRLADVSGEQLPVMLGVSLATVGFACLSLPEVSLSGPLALAFVVPVGLGLGLLFAPTSRAALNSVDPGRHGRVSAALSSGRLAGAALGSGLAGAAVAGHVDAAAVHHALLVAAALCLFVGIPAGRRLRACGASRSVRAAP